MIGTYYIGIVASNDTYTTERPKLVLVGPDLPPLSVQPASLGNIKAMFAGEGQPPTPETMKKKSEITGK